MLHVCKGGFRLCDNAWMNTYCGHDTVIGVGWLSHTFRYFSWQPAGTVCDLILAWKDVLGFIYTAAFHSVRLLSVHMFLQKWSAFRALALWSVASCNAGHCCTCFYSYSDDGVIPCQKALERLLNSRNSCEKPRNFRHTLDLSIV